MSDIKWSAYSEAIFDTWASTSDNIIVSACPGSGKTTNIKHLCTDTIPIKEDTLYLAFNKAIVTEAAAKLPGYITTLTLNSLGHRAVIGYFGSEVRLDKDKVFRIIRKEIKQGRLETKTEYNDRVGDIAKAVALLKINTQMDEIDFSGLCSTFDIDEYPSMYTDCTHVLGISDDDTKTIDFNDQLRFPVIHDLPMRCYDNIMVDESQDLNSLQAAMIGKLNGRYCFVGDPHQAIYGFRGAMNNSMTYLKDTFECIELPMRLTYRCSRSVVEQARFFFTDIEALVEAPEGTVSTMQPGHTALAQAGDLVLCRNNAPLTAYAFHLLRNGIACHIRGRDIGIGLVKLIDKLSLGMNSLTHFSPMLEEWRAREVAKAIEKDDRAKVGAVNDKADSIAVILSQCHGYDPVSVLRDKVQSLFNAENGVLLSTVHKAKGLEADNVFILNANLMPSKYATRPWEIEQEKNIQYVAVTRAKNNLVYM